MVYITLQVYSVHTVHTPGYKVTKHHQHTLCPPGPTRWLIYSGPSLCSKAPFTAASSQEQYGVCE